MKKLGLGKGLSQLQNQIKQLKTELAELESSRQDIPELIDSTNLLRTNEYLSNTDVKKTTLLDAYAIYSEHLETLLSTTLEIQNELKNLLRQQSEMIEKNKKPSRTTSSKK